MLDAAALADALEAGRLACRRCGAVPSLPDRGRIAAGLTRRDKADLTQHEETTP